MFNTEIDSSPAVLGDFGKRPETEFTAACRIPSVWQKVVRFWERRSGLSANKLIPAAPAGAGPCVMWRGSRLWNGYGSLAIGLTKEEQAEFERIYGRPGPEAVATSPHRVSVYLKLRRVASGGAVRHSCDNRMCVNPDHLTMGTQVENMQDARVKGRMNASLHRPRLSFSNEKLVKLMLPVVTGKATMRQTAEKNGISITHVSQMARGLSRPHILAGCKLLVGSDSKKAKLVFTRTFGQTFSVALKES